jgi:D-threo-aldose 1-dehydrogenase
VRKIRLGKTDLEVTPVCIGTGVLGDMPDSYTYRVGAERARATVRAIFDGPINFLDVSRNYGLGRSEQRIGDVVRERGGKPADLVISTKLDRDMESGRFDAGQARRSLEESLAALGVDRVEILHLHDPEYAAEISEITRSGGALDELFKIRDEGLCDYVGLAAGDITVMTPLIDAWQFDFMISHNRCSIINGNAETLMDRANTRGTVVLNAAPYMGGVLAKGTDAFPRLTYMPATPPQLAPVRQLERICRNFRVPLGAAALQFSLRNPRVGATICGCSRPERIAQTVAWSELPIPDRFWAEAGMVPRSFDDPEADRVYRPG